MNEIIGKVLMLAGSVFMLLAAIGVLRLPDIFMRMQAAAKGATLGAACLLLGAAFHFGDISATSRLILIMVFLFLTTPIATHMIARAAYIVGVPLWHGTIRDDLQDRYDSDTHVLRSPDDDSSSG